MNDLKEGDLVKVWNYDPKAYTVGWFMRRVYDRKYNVSVYTVLGEGRFLNAVKVPEDVERQLKKLGA